MKREPQHGEARQADFNDGRSGVDRDQEASCTPTFTTGSRAGVRLSGNPRHILADHAGTLTRAQYMAWRYGEGE